MSNPKIVDKDKITLVGMVFYGRPFKNAEGWTGENEIGKLWQRFITFMEVKGDLVKNLVDSNVGYEVYIEPDEYLETKNIYVMVGVEVDEVEDLPPEMFVKVLPPSTYAVFTLKGEEITSNWHETYEEWLSNSDYREGGKFMFEYYDERFKGLDNIAESEIDVYFPVTSK